MKRTGAAAVAVAALTGAAGVMGPAQASPVNTTSPATDGRRAEAVVLTGAQIPAWSRPAAAGVAAPYPSGATTGERSAHNGTIVVPPSPGRPGIDPAEVVAYRWDAAGHGRWAEIPVQVDQRFPYFLANPNSSFGIYSGTDTELTYQWDVEAWRKTAGQCAAAYPPGVSAMQDPVPTLDDDDEIAFMASDAGATAPATATPPPGVRADRQTVTLADPARPTAPAGTVYLFRRPGGSSFSVANGNGYVRYQRDADADQWIDSGSFPAGSTEALGISNRGYGPNLHGTVCDPDGTVRASTDRFPRDGVTVTTAAYRWHASGRWMVRDLRVAAPGAPASPAAFGPDLIDRWKGRAFQQSPDSSVSLVGFEDEQVNWEANSALLGERAGPVRAIREVWGADSGTNVTKTETFYRDAVAYRYHLRVHPIPPDGLYTSWDYNAGVATRYYNALHPDGVAIDGANDDVGNVDGALGKPFFTDLPDPTFDVPSAVYHWEQVSGKGAAGSLVYVLELKGVTSATAPAVVPYYRDDACFDDGTGDDPVARPWPGEASTDPRVVAAYAGAPCARRQGAWGENGVHYFATGDSDNAFLPVPVDEVDAQQWQFAVPTDHPHAVGESFQQAVLAPLVAAVHP